MAKTGGAVLITGNTKHFPDEPMISRVKAVIGIN